MFDSKAGSDNIISMWQQPFTKVALITLALVAVATVILLMTGRARASIGNLQVYQGAADIVRRGQQVSGSTGDPIRLGDTLKSAADSKVAIVLRDGSVIRLEAGSEVQVAELNYQGQKIKEAVFRLKFGRLWSRVAPLDPEGQFDVETPTAIAAVAGTSFNSDYLDRLTGFYVDRDQVNVYLKNQAKTLNAQKIETGLIIRLRDDHLEEDLAAGAKSPEPEFFDDWIRFNQAEDDKICQDQPLTPGCLEQSPRFQAKQPSAPQPEPLPVPPSTAKQPAATPAVLGVGPTQEATQASTPQPTPSTPSDPLSAETAPVVEPPALANQPTAQSTSVQPNPTDEGPLQPTPNPPLQSEPAPQPTPTPEPAPKPQPQPLPEKTLTALTLRADRTQVFINETVTLQALAKYSDKSETDVSKQVTWLFSQGSGRFNGHQFTATATGEVKLKASYQNLTSNEIILTVAAPQIERLELSHDKPTPEQTVQFHAIVHYNNGDKKDVTERVRWEVEQPTEATISKTGLYLANGQAQDTVKATLVEGQREISASTTIMLSRPIFNPTLPGFDLLPNNTLSPVQ